EIDAAMIAIVISKSDIEDSFGPRRIDPRLQKRPSVALDPVALWMTVIIGDKNWSVGVLECWSAVQFITPLLHCSTPHGAVMNFCRARSSGYLGKKTSTL